MQNHIEPIQSVIAVMAYGYRVDCQVIHAIRGRIRIRVRRLAYDAEYGHKLHWLIESLEFVTGARINPAASSLVVEHKLTKLPVVEVWERLFAAIQQATTVQIPQLPQASPPKVPANLRGIGLMLLATGSFAVMQAVIRYLSGSIHPFGIAFFSNLFGIVVLTPWLAASGLSALKTENLHLHGLRTLIDTGATLLLFAGLSMTPLALANALGFTTPLFAILGAVLLLGEQMQPHNWVALVMSIVGTLIVLQPGSTVIGLGPVLVLLAAATLAGVLLLVKILTKTDSNLTINAYTVLLLTPLTLIPALWVWQWPTLQQYFWLAVVAVLMVAGQVAYTQAFEEADLTTVLPVEFAQLLWASLLGFLIFSEVPNVWTWIGGLIIFAGSTYTAYAESANFPEPNS